MVNESWRAPSKARIVASKLVQLALRYLIRLYQFPAHGDREQKIDYYLTVGAYNSPTVWYKILGVYTIWNFIVLLSIHFSDASSCQPILKLLLDLPIIHEANVEATIAVFRPIAGFSTMSACVWKGPHLPHRVNIHGHW